jgi:hypothetical protein
MDATQVGSGLYVPYCTEEDGQCQPIATALWFEAGKQLCQQHFLQRCRTVKQRLLPGQGGEVPTALLDKIFLTWRLSPSGVYEGQPEGCLATPLAIMTGTTYKLHPAG